MDDWTDRDLGSWIYDNPILVPIDLPTEGIVRLRVLAEVFCLR